MGFRWGTDVQHLHTLFSKLVAGQLPRPASKLKRELLGKNQGGWGRKRKSVETLTPPKDVPSRTLCFNILACYRDALRSTHSKRIWVNKKPLNEKINPPPGLSFDPWHDDTDRAFILDGVKHRFNSIDQEIVITPAKCSNHFSAQPGSPLYDNGTKQERKEIENGSYVICDTPPKIISPMSAIHKPDGDDQW